ncbi:putative sulfate/molybdate transporter [Noviherbaspirillum sp. DKR-6]|uniref:Sulfate/molybdate transporter n=2 Tax=Noviherbaspirillum pedocola TaxID=2801341 RepID=A0A934W8M2_9BURK|nr:putative sulfate/molybdate transporter [Noviherbaspirillum pedocola]
MEWAGAFGDLGTLIPFVTAYIAVLHMDPMGILLGFGLPLVACGWFYRTPFPVQPMKAVGAAAATGAGSMAMLHGAPVIAAAWLTGAFWLAIGLSGLATRIARWVPREVGRGIVLGLSLGFMRDGARMMVSDVGLAAAGLALAFLLRRSKALPAMFALLLLGTAWSLATDASLLSELGHVAFAPRWPQWHGSDFSWSDLLTGAIYLALPQIPLTLGNAIIGTKEENNRLFPERPVSIRGIAVSTGLINLFGATVGGVPMCHGAGGIVAHTSFGARTGGASIILGTLLIGLALGFSGSVELLLRTLPAAVVGVILFIAGALLARGNLPRLADKRSAVLVLLTAGAALWNVAAAFVFGLGLAWLLKRRAR